MIKWLFTFLLSLLAIPAAAQFAVQDLPAGQGYDFVPVKVWHFGETQMAEGQVCVFSNAYNNGFTIQIVEQQGMIRAALIDFAQDVFEPGRFYPMILQANGTPREVRGLATAPSVIRFNFAEPISSAFFEQYDSNSLAIETEDFAFRFMLNGLSQSLKSISQCDAAPDKSDDDMMAEVENIDQDIDQAAENRDGAEQDQDALDVVTVGAEDPAIETQPSQKKLEIASLGVVDDLSVSPVAAVPPQEFDQNFKGRKADKRKIEDKVEARSSSLEKTASVIAAENLKWEAQKGMRLSETIAAWADQAGVYVKWQADSDLALKQNMTLDGSFEEAVAVLLKTVDEGSFASRMQDSIDDVEAVAGLNKREWRALHGMNLKTVMENWAEDAGVTLIWEAQDNFALPQEYRAETSFADAVAGVLDKFSDEGPRPVAQLNADPQTGELALIIRSQENNS